jgi:hypothetical protein
MLARLKRIKMAITKFEFIESTHPAPNRELPSSYTYFQLGCGACEHSVDFRVSGKTRTTEIAAAVSHISPQRITHQGLTRAVSRICPANGKNCPAAEQIGATVNLLDKAYNRD